MKKKNEFKPVIILGIIDVILFILPKLVSLLASLFGMLAKIPIIGIPFSLIQTLLLFIARIGSIPFYICTIILVILLIIKLIKMFKGRMQQRKARQIPTSNDVIDANDIIVENTQDVGDYKQSKMDFFN